MVNAKQQADQKLVCAVGWFAAIFGRCVAWFKPTFALFNSQLQDGCTASVAGTKVICLGALPGSMSLRRLLLIVASGCITQYLA